MTHVLATPTEKIVIPNYLIKEVIDGIPYYYKDYQSVLNKEKTLEDIMGSSTLQSVIIHILMKYLFLNLGDKKYFFLTNEIGNHLEQNSNLSIDLAIFEKSTLTAEKINEKYANVPAKVVLEIDVKIDINDQNEIAYISNKTDKLLEFGTERVIWILTKSKKVIVAEPNKDWIFAGWDRDIILVDGQSFNIAELLKGEGIED